MKNGIPNYNEIVFTKEQKEEIVRLYVEEKLSTPKIGKIMNSRHICNSLENLGAVRNKSLVLEFPDIPEKLYSHFIRGYYDGDGSVYRYVKNENNKHITLTITSTENFCKKIKEIVEKELGIYCGIYEASCHNGITKVISLGGTSAVKLMDWMYKDADLYLQRKYDRYIEYTAA